MSDALGQLLDERKDVPIIVAIAHHKKRSAFRYMFLQRDYIPRIRLVADLRERRRKQGEHVAS